MNASLSIQHLVSDVNKLSDEDRETIYGITILPDKRVIDVIENKTYKTLMEWAIAFTEDDGSGGLQASRKTRMEFYEGEY